MPDSSIDAPTVEDAQFAVRAVVIHAAEAWPTGPLCRNERVPHPCHLHRWGRHILRSYGLSERQIDELVARGDPFAVPVR